MTVVLPVEGVAKGTISAKQKVASCFTLDAKAGREYDLNLTRTKGDLHLGFVVLSPTNEVVAQSSLIASHRFETGLIRPQGWPDIPSGSTGSSWELPPGRPPSSSRSGRSLVPRLPPGGDSEAAPVPGGRRD